MTSRASLRWLWISIAVVVADQASKYALERFTRLGYVKALLPGCLNLVHAQNRGVAFSMFAASDSPWLRPALLVFSTAVILLLGWMLTTGRAGGCLTRAGLALVVGGAAGNAFDRLLFGAVTDFVDVYAGAWHWPSFNVADSAITIGAALILWEMIFGSRGEEHGGQSSAPPATS